MTSDDGITPLREGVDARLAEARVEVAEARVEVVQADTVLAKIQERERRRARSRFVILPLPQPLRSVLALLSILVAVSIVVAPSWFALVSLVMSAMWWMSYDPKTRPPRS